jgi:hypothetical protein
MSQRNYKMLAIVDTNYNGLDQLRNKYGSFNDVVSKLLELYHDDDEEREPQNVKENGSQAVSGLSPTTQLDVPPTTAVNGAVILEYTKSTT